MTRRILVLAVICVFALAALSTGYGLKVEKLNKTSDDKSSTTQTTAKEAKPKTLTFWRPGTEPEETGYWKRVISEYEEFNPGLKIELSEVAWGNEIEAKLNAAFASGTAPDILAYAIVSVAQRAGIGQYEVLDPYIEKWEDKDDMVDNVYEMGRYKGKVYGLAYRPDPKLFVWRKDFFREAGLDPEKPPKTWDELADYAVKLTKKDGNATVRAGFNIPVANGFQYFQTFVLQNGCPGFIDIDTLEPFFDSPEAIEAAAYLTDLVRKGVTIHSDQLKSQENIFVAGKAAMAYEAPDIYINLIKSNPDMKDKVGVTGPIEHKAKGTFCGANLLFMPTDSKEKETSWDFIKYIMSKEETIKRYYERRVPVLRKSLQGEYINDDPIVNQAVIDAINVGQGAAKVIFSSRLDESISLALEQAYYGRKTPEQAFKDAANDLRKEISNLVKK